MREALSLAIDREGITSRVMGGAVLPAASLGTPAMFGTKPGPHDRPQGRSGPGKGAAD